MWYNKEKLIIRRTMKTLKIKASSVRNYSSSNRVALNNLELYDKNEYHVDKQSVLLKVKEIVKKNEHK